MKREILILEDDPFICDDMALLVEERLGLIPVTSAAAATAVLRLSDNTAAAVLDVNVADGDSFPVASRLSERHIPFMFVSANDRRTLPSEWQHVTFLQKPAAPSAIEGALRYLMA